MSFSLVQATTAGSTGGPTATTTFGSSVTAGNMILVYASAASPTGVITVSDGVNTYTLDASSTSGSTAPVVLYRAKASMSAALTITATTTSGWVTVYAEEWQTPGTVSLGTPSSLAGGSSPFAPGNVTFGSTASLVVAALGVGAGTSSSYSSASGYTLGAHVVFSAGTTTSGLATEYQANLAASSSPQDPAITATGASGAGIVAIAYQAGPTTATLSGPTSGPEGAQGTAFTVTLDKAAPIGGVVVTPASTGSGDTFQATSGGGNVTTITIAQGQTTGTFYPTAGSTGWRSISITTSPALAYPGSRAPYYAGPSRNYFSTVSGFAAGLSTVGYTVLGSDGTVKGVRTTTGVVALGNGGYAAEVAMPFSGAYAIRWDDGGSPANYAFDTVVPIVIDTDGLEAGQLMGLLRAYIVGKVSGFGSSGATSGQFLGGDGVTARISGPCDQYGNRSNPTINPLT